MLDEELKEIAEKAIEKKNFKNSLLSLAILILYGVITFWALDSFNVGHSIFFSRILIILSYGFLGSSILVAFLALKGSLKSIKASKRSLNYIAIVISILVLVVVILDISSRI